MSLCVGARNVCRCEYNIALLRSLARDYARGLGTINGFRQFVLNVSLVPLTLALFSLVHSLSLSLTSPTVAIILSPILPNRKLSFFFFLHVFSRFHSRLRRRYFPKSRVTSY